MRIAYVCADPGVPVHGRKGCSIHVQEVIRGMVRRGAQVELFAARVGGLPSPDLTDVPIQRLPRVREREVAAREKACTAANQPLRRSLERSVPFDILYERYSLWSYAGLEYAREAGLPGLLEVNAPLIDESRSHRHLSDEAQADRITRRAFSSASHLITVSEELSGYAGRWGVTPEKIHVVPNGVNLDRFASVRRRPRGSVPFTVGFVGSLKPWHDLATLIEAFRTLHRSDPNCLLLVVGDGPGGSRLSEELAGSEIGTAVILQGSVQHSEVPSQLRLMDVAVAPYPHLSDFYFSPLKVFEYMAAGLPVVTARIGQLATVIEDDMNGLLYSPEDSRALGEALLRLRASPPLRQRLGNAARNTALQKHSWDCRVKSILEIAGARRSTLVY